MVPLKDLRIQPLCPPKRGTKESTQRPFMNAGNFWHSCFFPIGALRRQQLKYYCHCWQALWFSSGTRASTRTSFNTSSRTTTVWHAYRHISLEPATEGANRSTFVRALGKNSISTSNIGEAWGPAARNPPQRFSLTPPLVALTVPREGNK